MREEADCFQIEEVKFKELFRVTKDMAHFLFNGITPALTRSNNPVVIPPQARFFGALHFYATGSYQIFYLEYFNA